MSIGQGVFGAVLIALSIWAYWRNRFPRARTWAVFIGILLFGINGLVLTWAARGLQFLGGLLGGISAKVLGLSAEGVIVVLIIVLIAELLHGWHPKGKAGKGTYWIAATMAILIVAGATPFAALNNLPGSVQQGINQVQG